MANSTALAYRQYEDISNTGIGAGTQVLHILWHMYQYFFVDAEAVDAGRWRLVDSSPAAGSWTTLSNVVDNSWFVVEAQSGRRQWQAKFQASNVAALDESPSSSYSLVVNLCSGGGWTAKGGGNGGFTASSVFCTQNKLISGTDQSGNPVGKIFIHGDRDTVLIANTLTGTADYAGGAYLGRFEPDTSKILYPECVLVPWDGAGSPIGFDRYTAGGVFAETPADSAVLDETSPTPVIESCQVWTPGWLSTGNHEPSAFSGEYHYRPMEVTCDRALLGTLRLVVACSNIVAKSRLLARQYFVLHNDHAAYGVAIQHNGLIY
jgi:hypothetical protein